MVTKIFLNVERFKSVSQREHLGTTMIMVNEKQEILEVSIEPLMSIWILPQIYSSASRWVEKAYGDVARILVPR